MPAEQYAITDHTSPLKGDANVCRRVGCRRQGQAKLSETRFSAHGYLLAANGATYLRWEVCRQPLCAAPTAYVSASQRSWPDRMIVGFTVHCQRTLDLRFRRVQLGRPDARMGAHDLRPPGHLPPPGSDLRRAAALLRLHVVGDLPDFAALLTETVEDPPPPPRCW